MDQAALLAMTAVVSAGVGSLIAIVAVGPSRRSARVFRVDRDTVVRSIAQFADSYGTAGLLTDSHGHVVHASATASALGIVKRRKVTPAIVRAAIDHSAKTGEGATAELVLDSDPSPAPLSAQIHTIPLGGDFVLVLVDDSSESRRLEETRRDFVANISHELKTPIGAITLLAEALQDEIDDLETVAKFSQNIHKESVRLARIVNDIIQLSRVQGREILRESQTIRLDSVIADAIDQTSVLAEDKKVAVKVRQSENVIVLGDAPLLTVAVKNLVENAIQFSENGGVVRIIVKAAKRFVTISVADEGIGIAPEDRSRVFERFYRVDASRSRKTGGTGLGLSIVKHIVIAHRGDVTVDSELGFGSVFTITLPRFTTNRKAVRL